MNAKLIISIASLLMVILTPVVFLIFEKKKNKVKIKFWDVIVGIVVEFLFKYVLVNILINTLTFIPLFEGILTNILGYLIVYFLLTSLSIICGLYLVYKFYFGGNMNASSVVGITIGMCIATILNTTLMVAISNIVYLFQESNGTFLTNLLAQVSESQALEIVAQYESFGLNYYLYVGIITVAMLASSYLTSSLFCKSTKDKGIKNYLIVFAAIIIYSVMYYFNDPTVMTFANPLLLVFAGMQFIFAEINNRTLA